MLKVSTLEIQQNLEEYLKGSLPEPILIERSDGSSAVMLSVAEYERLQALDDAYWGEKARQAIAQGYADAVESERTLAERFNETP